jgi:hypothetical protein
MVNIGVFSMFICTTGIDPRGSLTLKYGYYTASGKECIEIYLQDGTLVISKMASDKATADKICNSLIYNQITTKEELLAMDFSFHWNLACSGDYKLWSEAFDICKNRNCSALYGAVQNSKEFYHKYMA